MQKYQIVKLYGGFAVRKHHWYSFIPGFGERCFYDIDNEDNTWIMFAEDHCIFANIDDARNFIKNKRKKLEKREIPKPKHIEII